MALPKRIGGTDEEEKKPSLVIALGMKPKKGMPSRIGGDDEEESEGSKEEGWQKEAKLKAMKLFVNELGRTNPSVEKLTASLTSFFQACDAEPHEEGEHTEEEGSE